MNDLKKILGQYSLGSVQKFKNLSVIPIKVKKKSNIDYILFGEALDKNKIDIIETGVVNKLKIRKQTPKDVLVVKGEYVVGGKQNRVVSVNGLIGKKEINLPVHCMEHGRWRYGNNPGIEFEETPFPRSPNESRPRGRFGGDLRSPRIVRYEIGWGRPKSKTTFSTGKSFFSSAIRSSISKDGSRGGGQGQTWNSISYLSEALGSFSSTQDFNEILGNKKEVIDDYLKNIESVKGNGVIAKIGNTFYIDLFDKEQSFKKQSEKILQSYIIDAIATKRKTAKITKNSAKEFLEDILTSDVEKSKSLDLGNDYELDDKRGSALVYKNTMLYLGARG